ncbi:exodeoxyribonuclease VII small subunit [Fusobacterium sp. PH5-44]|uniref:exodeoxyribonuclease VII small subunit n=1 Tax=unclassified Fusobacterium TaxID=2648384 RepID=UPI003D21824C
MKKNTFEENLNNIDEIINRIENGELTLDDSIKEYEKAMKLLKESSDMLKDAEGKIFKITETETEEVK